MASSPEIITAWRIVNADYAATAFDGEGASRVGGRWTSPGRRAAYAADSIALAALEILVHLQSVATMTEFVVVPARFPRSLVRRITLSMLPRTWKAWPAPPALRQFGDEWHEAKWSPVLAVPSVVVDAEENYVINPAHPDFARIEIDQARPFRLDARLAR